MKLFFFFAFCTLTIISNGQSQRNKKPVTQWQPLIYFDSIEFRFEKFGQLHFDVDKIADIKVFGNYFDSINEVHGKMFIKTKDPNDFNFLSLNAIRNCYTTSATLPTVFMLDNDFIKDTTGFRVDSSYILKVDVLKGNDFEYLKSFIPNLTIVKIKTRTKENLDEENRIYIRGKESASTQ